MKFYFTFGQSHVHEFEGRRFDKDTVVEIEAEDQKEARGKMFNNFGKWWAMEYRELPDMSFYPGGIKKL